jgi:hypothetical protein
MRTLSMLLMAMALVALPACSGGEEKPADTGVENTLDDVTNGAENASKEVAEKICCGGACPTPAGFCCTDGTCGDNHKELPVYQP